MRLTAHGHEEREMSYETALKAAGAEVHCFESFGSYQGDWWAKVTYNGVTGWINGSYGSCSGCDAFEAEFGWNDDEKSDYQERLAKFGAEYLDNIYSQEDALKKALEHDDWDLEAASVAKYITENQ